MNIEEIELSLGFSFKPEVELLGSSTRFSIQGEMNWAGSILSGDCIRIEANVPYASALEDFMACDAEGEAGSFSCGEDDFYQPFPAGGSYTATDETSAGAPVTVERVSGSILQLTLGADTLNKFHFDVGDLVNPFSQNGLARFTILHYPQCNTDGDYTPCDRVDS